jgi:hypothetical protein
MGVRMAERGRPKAPLVLSEEEAGHAGALGASAEEPAELGVAVQDRAGLRGRQDEPGRGSGAWL